MFDFFDYLCPLKSTKMKNLPLGRQDFAALREDDCLYVDKTELIYKLVTNGKRYFLSRPRRFGKSLTISTLDAIFNARFDLFHGLWIENKYDWKKYPIIKLSFESISSLELSTQELLKQELHLIAQTYGLSLKNKFLKDLTSELITKLSATEKVVILIDEYDKPILDAIPHNFALAYERRETLKEFFETLKKEDSNIHFIFVTGVSKFAKTTLFSGANQLIDISLSPDFATLCGYTQVEMEANFSSIFAELAENQQLSEDEILPEIKTWYNGYNFRGTSVYNPWSILSMAFDRRISNYWFKTGSPSFLLRYLKEGLYYKLANMNVNETVLESYDIEKIDYRALLFQAGYLTIANENPREQTYVLDYPNKEVELSLSQHILANYAETNLSDAGMSALDIREALNVGDLERFKTIVNSLFASIPGPIFLKKYEAYYHSILHTMFTLLAFYAQCEVNTAIGRADAVVHLPHKIFIFEFKINGSAKVALEQILKNDYAGKYAASGKKITLVGVGLSKTKKGIVSMEVENI
jgi:hypothetical protein